MRILHIAQADGGGGAASTATTTATPWTETLSPEQKAFVTTKGWDAPAKVIESYQHLEKHMGVDRIPKPRPDWKPEQWSEFYNTIGRPETPDKYETPQVTLEDGVTIDEKILTDAKANLHKLGLTAAQTKGVLEQYFGIVNTGAKTAREAQAAVAAEATNKLKNEWKERFDANLDIAKGAIRKFGSPEIITHLEQSGLGNHPEVVKLFHKVGLALLEDSATGRGEGLQVTTATSALQEIEKLKMDAEWMKGFHNGDKAKIAKWNELFQQAYPSRTQTA